MVKMDCPIYRDGLNFGMQPHPQGAWPMVMQTVFSEVSKRLTSKNPDSDRLLELLTEIQTIEKECRKKNWRPYLRRVAKAYGLKKPRCLK